MSEDAGIEQLFPNVHGLYPGTGLSPRDEPVDKLSRHKRALVGGEVVLAILDQVGAVIAQSAAMRDTGQVTVHLCTHKTLHTTLSVFQLEAF